MPQQEQREIVRWDDYNYSSRNHSLNSLSKTFSSWFCLLFASAVLPFGSPSIFFLVVKWSGWKWNNGQKTMKSEDTQTQTWKPASYITTIILIITTTATTSTFTNHLHSSFELFGLGWCLLVHWDKEQRLEPYIFLLPLPKTSFPIVWFLTTLILLQNFRLPHPLTQITMFLSVFLQRLKCKQVFIACKHVYYLRPLFLWDI